MEEADFKAGDAHLDEATWERLACGELSPEALRLARAHIRVCAECTRIDGALRGRREEARAFDPGVPAEPAPARPITRWLAVAAGLVLAVGGTGYFLRAVRVTDKGPLVVRGVPTPRPKALSPVGPQKVAPQTFEWSQVPGAHHYQVTLFGPDAQALWTSPQTDQTRIAWPAQVRPEGAFYWQVVALPQDVVSEMADLTIGPGADRR